MKTPILISAIVACALAAPIVSAQEKSAPAKPAMSMDMENHMSQMQEKMKAMRGMGGATMMGGGEHGGMMMGGKKGGMKSGMKDGDMMKHQEMMEKRMDMMQMMMEQMMQHDQATQSMPAK